MIPETISQKVIPENDTLEKVIPESNTWNWYAKSDTQSDTWNWNPKVIPGTDKTRKWCLKLIPQKWYLKVIPLESYSWNWYQTVIPKSDTWEIWYLTHGVSLFFKWYLSNLIPDTWDFAWVGPPSPCFLEFLNYRLGISHAQLTSTYFTSAHVTYAHFAYHFTCTFRLRIYLRNFFPSYLTCATCMRISHPLKKHHREVVVILAHFPRLS